MGCAVNARKSWIAGPKRGVHSWKFDQPSDLPPEVQEWRELQQEDREKEAQLRLLQKGHRNPALPATSEQLPDGTARGFWFGAAAVLLIEGLLWCLNMLTVAVMGGAS